MHGYINACEKSFTLSYSVQCTVVGNLATNSDIALRCARYRDQIECVESDFRVHLAKKEEQIRTNLEVYEQRSKIQSEEICRIRMEAELDRAEAVKAERTIAMEERAVLEKQHTVRCLTFLTLMRIRLNLI